MTAKENLEEKLEKLGQAIAGDDALVENVMSRIDQANGAVKVKNKPLSRRLLTNRFTKLATAAVIVIAVLIGIHQFGGSIEGVAWADVEAAFLTQPWVHLKYDNGAELWYDLQNGRSYYKNWLGICDGHCVFIDRVLNIRQRYVPEFGEHISEGRPVIYPEGMIPLWEPKTAWEKVVGPMEKMAGNGGMRHWEVEKHLDQISGKQLVRFDRYYNDAVGRRLLIKQIWADPETRLPVKVWERLQLAHREEQNREFIIGQFDFPESGPTSIYDLGVPRDLPIVKNYDKVAVPSIVEVVEAGKAATERFPTRYRAIRWDNDEESEIEVVWRNGEKVHHYHYFNLPVDEHPQYHLELPVTSEEVLNWTKTQPPVSIYIFDGERQYSRHQHPAFDDMREPEVRVMRLKEDLLPSGSKPVEQWPYANRNPNRFEYIEDAPDELSNYIGLRIDMADIRRDFYIDPERDYICVRWIWWKERSGKWEKKREYELSDFARLPQGQLYAKKRILITYPDPERGTDRGGANWNIDVKVLEEDEYPPDTFNGEKLLEGAKIETY